MYKQQIRTLKNDRIQAMLSSAIAQSQLLVSHQRILNTIGIISRYQIIGKHSQLIVIVYYYLTYLRRVFK